MVGGLDGSLGLVSGKLSTLQLQAYTCKGRFVRLTLTTAAQLVDVSNFCSCTLSSLFLKMELIIGHIISQGRGFCLWACLSPFAS